jgi:hypothetical protein
MTGRRTQASEAIRDSWDLWLEERSPLTLPPLVDAGFTDHGEDSAA